MKITVDIEDFWMDENSGNLEEELRNHVTQNVIREVCAKIGAQVNKEISEQCTELINGRIKELVNEKLAELLQSETIMRGSKEIKISDHVRELFQNNSGWNNPNDQIKKIADRYGEELKMQYNKIFATHIVVALKNQGMLKDDVAQMLLENPQQIK